MTHTVWILNTLAKQPEQIAQTLAKIFPAPSWCMAFTPRECTLTTFAKADPKILGEAYEIHVFSKAWEMSAWRGGAEWQVRVISEADISETERYGPRRCADTTHLALARHSHEKSSARRWHLPRAMI